MRNHVFPILLLLLLEGFPVHSQTWADWLNSEEPVIEQWLEQQIARAKEGKAETVEIPLVVRSTGWGCRCPEHYMGSNAFTQDGPWIAPVGKSLPAPDENGYLFVAKGKFTGNLVEIDLREENGEPEEWLCKAWEFRVTKVKKLKAGVEMPAPKVLN
jgi:hypothetical protein